MKPSSAIASPAGVVTGASESSRGAEADGRQGADISSSAAATSAVPDSSEVLQCMSLPANLLAHGCAMTVTRPISDDASSLPVRHWPEQEEAI